MRANHRFQQLESKNLFLQPTIQFDLEQGEFRVSSQNYLKTIFQTTQLLSLFRKIDFIDVIYHYFIFNLKFCINFCTEKLQVQFSKQFKIQQFINELILFKNKSVKKPSDGTSQQIIKLQVLRIVCRDKLFMSSYFKTITRI